MPKSWVLGHPEYLLDEWLADPSLTFQDSMQTAVFGPGRWDYSPFIPCDSLIFWTRVDVSLLRVLAWVNPKLLCSFQICPFAENEALTGNCAVEIRLIAQGKLAEIFSQRFDNHYWHIRNPRFPWNNRVSRRDPRQDLDEVFSVANGHEQVHLVPGARPTRVISSKSAQPPHVYGTKLTMLRQPEQPRGRPSKLTQARNTGTAVLYHVEPREGIDLPDDEPINPVAREQSCEPAPYGAGDSTHAAFHGFDRMYHQFGHGGGISALHQPSPDASDAPPSRRNDIGTSDLLTRPYPSGDILLNVLRDFRMHNTEAFLNHGRMFDWHAAVGLDPFHTIWTNTMGESQYPEPSDSEPSPSLDLQETPTPPIPYNRASSYCHAEAYFDGLIGSQLSRTWEYTSEDEAMVQRLRSGNPPNESRQPSDTDSANFELLYARTPQEIWLSGPTRKSPECTPAETDLCNLPCEPDLSPGIEQEAEVLHPETNQSERGSGDYTERPTTSYSFLRGLSESTVAMDDGLAYVYPPIMHPLVEDTETREPPPIIEINQGQYRSYRDFAKLNRILHDLPEEDKRIYLCVFCKGNDEPPSVYQSHPIRINSIVSCPYLRLHVCQLCKATGDEAHTIKYCPKNKRGFFATKAQARGKELETTTMVADSSSDDLVNISEDSSPKSSQSEVGTELGCPNSETMAAVDKNAQRNDTVARGSRRTIDRLFVVRHRPRRRPRRSTQTVRNAQG